MGLLGKRFGLDGLAGIAKIVGLLLAAAVAAAAAAAGCCCWLAGLAGWTRVTFTDSHGLPQILMNIC